MSVRFGLWYDFRNPDPERPFSRFYSEVLEQIAWAEGAGLESVWLSEHHFCDDGYTPSPLVIAAAIAARTERLSIGTNLMLLPLYDPIRIAEDAATVALLSGGRFELGVGLGYRALEYEAFGRSLRQRPSLMEEAVEILRRAWSGEPVAFQGRRFSVPSLSITPQPDPPPPLLIGGMALPAIERAARIGDGFLSTNNEHHSVYLDACERLHGNRDAAAIYAGQWAVIDDDPERTWARIGDHAVAQLNQYISWGAFGPPDEVPQFADRQAVLERGAYTLWDGDTAVREIARLVRGCPQIRDIHFWAQLPGEAVSSGTRRIGFLTTHVLPKVRAQLARSESR
jgi:alkanesulfonate monooxygenase SsuD/methylene tetrahydromethanopterin reductase-like flavin-dependent oxidoreductase (luciferase family)